MPSALPTILPFSLSSSLDESANDAMKLRGAGAKFIAIEPNKAALSSMIVAAIPTVSPGVKEAFGTKIIH